MTAPDVTSPEAAERAIHFLASLAADATPDMRAEAWEQLAEVMTGPAEMNTILFTLVSVGGGMWEAVTGERPGLYSFQIETPFGPVPVDSAPPHLRWVARWLTASLNGDSAMAADLWFSSGGTEDDAKAAVNVFVPVLVQFLTGAVRAFLAAGKPFPSNFGNRFEEWS